MKRKKWTEAEEVTLLSAYEEFTSSTSTSTHPLNTREKRLQPVADRVNSLHHLRDPSSFPFLWSWRDVSVKIHNMRNQYLGVKSKIALPPGSPSPFDWDLAIHHWPNFLRYKHVFGDLDLHGSPNDDVDEDDEGRPRAKRALAIARRIAEVEEAVVGREEGRSEREEEERERRRRMSLLEDEEEEERWRRRRRREERREEEEREWMERLLRMQMEHEKTVMQMQVDAFQMQLQVTSMLARVMCQIIGPVGAGDAGMGVLQNLPVQEQQQDQGSMGPENGKSDTSSRGNTCEWVA